MICGVELFDVFGEFGVVELWVWVVDLCERFCVVYWVIMLEGCYFVIVLDVYGVLVDIFISNIGYLIGIGIFDFDEEWVCVVLLIVLSMLSGYGICIMLMDVVGYWLLSYYGGSVWVYDMVIVVYGMLCVGFDVEVWVVVE